MAISPFDDLPPFDRKAHERKMALQGAASDMLTALQGALEHTEYLASFHRIDAKVCRAAAKREPGTSYAVECLRKAEDFDRFEKRENAEADKLRTVIAKAEGRI